MKWNLPAGLLLAICTAVAQPRLSFEVASVKPAVPLASKVASDGQLRLGTQIAGNRVQMTFVTLADIVRQAYRLKSFQFRGPEWMSNERYDIVAKIPDGATKEQVPEMMQTLLEERFKFQFRREQKEENIYALIAQKGGIKLKQVEPDPPGEAAGTATLTGRVQAIAPGHAQTPGGPGTVAMGGPGMQLDRKMTMAAFSEYLTRFVDKPVFDMTETTATYQVVMEIPAEEFMKMIRNGTAVVIGHGGGVPILPTADSASDPASESAVFAIVQQMGLKLDKRKAPIDLLVAERAEKIAVE